MDIEYTEGHGNDYCLQTGALEWVWEIKRPMRWRPYLLCGGRIFAFPIPSFARERRDLENCRQSSLRRREGGQKSAAGNLHLVSLCASNERDNAPYITRVPLGQIGHHFNPRRVKYCPSSIARPKITHGSWRSSLLSRCV